MLAGAEGKQHLSASEREEDLRSAYTKQNPPWPELDQDGVDSDRRKNYLEGVSTTSAETAAGEAATASEAAATAKARAAGTCLWCSRERLERR